MSWFTMQPQMMRKRVYCYGSCSTNQYTTASSRPRATALIKTLERFHRQLNEIDPTAIPANAVDLLIRFGGGYCSSDFMLWESEHAVLRQFDCPWPQFKPCQFHDSLDHHAGWVGYVTRLRSRNGD